MSASRQAVAWAVHLLTASSAVACLLALSAIADERWVIALSWLALAMLVDSFDGMLARAFAVRRSLPGFDGALLDNIVDYAGYVLVPAVFLVRAGLLPEATALGAAALVVLSSAYQFCQVDAKTDDHFFKGFPSFWNVTAFYLFYAGLPELTNLAVVLLLCVAAFVPVKWAYPSRMSRGRGPMLAASVIWGASVAAVLLWGRPGEGGVLLALSFLYVPCYAAISLWLSSAARAPEPSATRPGS